MLFRSRHQLACLPTLPARRRDASSRRRADPLASPPLSRAILSSPSPHLSRPKSPSPPSIAIVASATAAPPRHTSQLRRDHFSLLTEQSNPGELRFIAIAVVFKLRPTRSPSSLRLPQAFPELATDAVGSAVSSATVPLSSPPRFRAVASFPTTAEASRRRPCRSRRLGPPPPKPSIPSRFQCHEGATEPLRWPPRAPQPIPARSRAPAAAASFAPASSGLPSSSHLPHQMRESLGYAPVLSDAAPVACITDTAASRGRHRRPRRPDGWAPSAR